MAVFGKRPAPAPSPMTQSEPAAEVGQGPQAAEGHQTFPWSEDRSASDCTFAFLNLFQLLAAPIQKEGRVHAESYVAAAGAVAGFAAQRALFDQAPPVPGANIHVATAAHGREFWFGDALNLAIVGIGNDAEKLWPQAAGAAIAAGLPPAELPTLEALFAHVSRSIGTPIEGRPSVAAQPQQPVLDLLQRTWPVAEQCLTGKIAAADGTARAAAPVRWWPCITAIVAARSIIQVQKALSPAVSLVILMESAIYASKLMVHDVKRDPGRATN